MPTSLGGPGLRPAFLQTHSSPEAIPLKANFGEPKLVIGMKWNENGRRGVCNCLKNGGQGRNRTADASLFRAARSITYDAPYMKTKELHDNDLDSIWTPVVNLFEFGLHQDSTINRRILFGKLIAFARTRAI